MTDRQAVEQKAFIGVVGSGNVFADLGLPEPETHLAKANVVKVSTYLRMVIRGLFDARYSCSACRNWAKNFLGRYPYRHSCSLLLERRVCWVGLR